MISGAKWIRQVRRSIMGATRCTVVDTAKTDQTKKSQEQHHGIGVRRNQSASSSDPRVRRRFRLSRSRSCFGSSLKPFTLGRFPSFPTSRVRVSKSWVVEERDCRKPRREAGHPGHPVVSPSGTSPEHGCSALISGRLHGGSIPPASKTLAKAYRATYGAVNTMRMHSRQWIVRKWEGARRTASSESRVWVRIHD